MTTGNEPQARLNLNARLLLLTDEIERLRLLDPDDQRREALGPKIDEAAELLERIGLLNFTSPTTSRPAM